MTEIRSPTSQGQIDPFTVEVIKQALISAAEEMFISLGRTSKSPVIYDVLDYGCAITDGTGRMIAQANGIPPFIGVLTYAVRDTIDKFGLDGFDNGDVVIINDPYMGGATHQNDVVLVMPIFHHGEIVMFAVTKAHWNEVGGKDPGSWTPSATEIYQEGIQFPAVKIVKNGEEDEEIIEILRRNVRTPEMTLADMRAQVASMKVADRRINKVLEKYGYGTVEGAIEASLEQGKKEALRELSELPKGEFTAEDFIDDDGITDEPIPVKVRVKITDDKFLVDFTGSGGTTQGPINSPLSSTWGSCKTAFKAVVSPHAHPNEGFFAPLEVIAPDDTVFNPKRPAPISTYWEAASYVGDLVWKALAEAVPDRITAGHFLSVCATNTIGVDEETGKQFIFAEPNAGGWGAGKGKDGESGLVCSGDGDTYVLSIEVAETRYSIIVDQFALNITDAGHGKYRGGFGIIKDYKAVNDEIKVTASFGRSKFAPWGIDGGGKGSPNYVEMHHNDGEVLKRGRFSTHPLSEGEFARFYTGTGGGYGDPMKRDPEKVLSDVLDDYISLDIAREVYGVVIDPETMTINKEKTQQLR